MSMVPRAEVVVVLQKFLVLPAQHVEVAVATKQM